jgi:hypothetical protein
MSNRDYKDEYNKFQKHKSKYRAKLNKYNRDKGTYGNGDGKDASHKDGGIVGFVDSNTNKGKKEKSRLKGSKRKQYAQRGGKMIGPSHEEGGIPIEVEGDEVVINNSVNEAASMHEGGLLALNENPKNYEIVKKDSKLNYRCGGIIPHSDARKRRK